MHCVGDLGIIGRSARLLMNKQSTERRDWAGTISRRDLLKLMGRPEV